jgi:hypothetical protein
LKDSSRFDERLSLWADNVSTRAVEGAAKKGGGGGFKFTTIEGDTLCRGAELFLDFAPRRLWVDTSSFDGSCETLWVE